MKEQESNKLRKESASDQDTGMQRQFSIVCKDTASI